MATRKIIQIVTVPALVFGCTWGADFWAVCDDGTLWKWDEKQDEWKLEPHQIPQPDGQS